jgi:hypothetical protein
MEADGQTHGPRCPSPRFEIRCCSAAYVSMSLQPRIPMHFGDRRSPVPSPLLPSPPLGPCVAGRRQAAGGRRHAAEPMDGAAPSQMSARLSLGLG